jgi:C-terminal processing protease CtpA/Prc
MKRKVWALLLTMTLILSMTACGETQETAAEAEGLASFDEVIALATENHKVYAEPNELENVDLSPYAINDTGLLTEAEMNALRTERSVADSVTVEEAKEDADLFFRTWKYAYSSYYFIGEDLFENAKQQVMAELDAKTDSISGSEFAEMLYSSMSFLRDDHSSINGKSPAGTEDALIEMAYIDQTISMDKDAEGYYLTYEDGKWYYVTASDEEIRIEPTLLENGKVVYCPMVLAAKGREESQDTLTLEKDGNSKEVTINWVMCEDAEHASEGIVSTETMGNVYYIDFLSMMPDIDEQYWGEYQNLCKNNTTGKYTTIHGQGEGIAKFLNTANEAKKYDAVIFDLRYTQGWTHWQLEEWIRAFTGEEDSVNETFLVRQNALRTLDNFPRFELTKVGDERCDMWSEAGRTCKNDIPLIILTDKSCGSSVEEACLRLRTIENSIVIGCNTAGCALGGSVQNYYLPHSGATFAIGGFMQFQGTADNIDGVGYNPDIWCEPEAALTSAVALLQNAGIANEEAAASAAEPVNLKIEFYGHSVNQDGIFGNVGDNNSAIRDEVKVTVDGKAVDDFEVRSADESLMEAKKGKGNVFTLMRIKSFNGKTVDVTVTYQGQDYVFHANDSSWNG